jgi:nickel/cobalt transporter (NiCoT) family protein
MIITSAFTVFTLGLRHGADPDHLAAIDNLTRNSAAARPSLSRFVGTFFASGHAVMVLAIAALLGYLGSRLTPHAQLIETAGTWISIAVLIVIASLNLRQIAGGETDRIAGAKTRLLPRALRNGNNPWLAIPAGLLFGFGFETSSQIATYAVALGADAGVLGALLVASMFSVGMTCTDTLDSVLVHRLVTYRAGRLPRVMRVWLLSVTAFAFAVAAYELLGVLGIEPGIPDIAVSALLVGTLLAVFIWIFLSTRPMRRIDSIVEQLP